MKKLAEKEAWGEVKQALRKLSDIYKYEYSMLYSTVLLKVLEKHTNPNKQFQSINLNGSYYNVGKTADGYLVTTYDEEEADEIVVGIIK